MKRFLTPHFVWGSAKGLISLFLDLELRSQLAQGEALEAF